jgi:hypothetical protein
MLYSCKTKKKRETKFYLYLFPTKKKTLCNIRALVFFYNENIFSLLSSLSFLFPFFSFTSPLSFLLSYNNMQKNSIFVLVCLCIASVFASIDIDQLAGIPSGVVCAMSVCPSQTASLSKRAPQCPSVCKDSCVIVDDVCCPGVQKAVCNTTAISDGGSSATPTKTPITSPSSSVVITSSSVTSGVSSPSSSSASSASISPSAVVPASAGSFVQPSITLAIVAIALCFFKLN